MILSLSACNFPGIGPGPVTEPPEEEEPENFIFGEGSELYFMYPEGIAEHFVNPIIDELFYYGVDVRTHSDRTQVMPHELIIGKSDREISKTAYDRLERMDLNDDGDLRFLIYSNGSSVAIAYDEDRESVCLLEAVNYFIDNFCAEELIKAQGVMYEERFNLYEYYSAIDEAKYAKQWKRLSEAYGPEITAAMKSYYSIYDGEKLMRWLINLFDPSICVCKDLYGEDECSNTQWCGTGGFYFSNSARDTVGYLPDVESTLQALGLLAALGMGGSYVSLLPEWMGEKIADFTYNLQDPDGFFYHPQWGKAISVSRRGRDFNWSRNILDAYGRDSRYPMMDDVEASSGALVPMLGCSSVMAVSKVIAAESELLIPEHLKTLENFKDYLENELDFYNEAYPAGNTLGSQSAQIKSRGPEYVDLMFEHMNKTQNSENGLWHPTAGYYGINGLMKISGIYKNFGRVIPNADKACLACIDAIMSEDDPSGIVDVWNAWVAVTYVFENVRLFAEDGEAKEAELKALLVSRSIEAINATRDKTSRFARDDGSYSYVQKGNCYTSQGAPVAVPGNSEGDVNGCMIATVQMVGFLFSGLGMNGYKVDLCGQRDRAIMLDLIANLSPVEKIQGDGSVVGEPLSFDYDDIGETPSDVTVSLGNSTAGSSVTVVKDPRGEGQVLSFKKASGSFDSATFKHFGSAVNAAETVFEAEMCIATASVATDFLRIEMGKTNDISGVYRLSFRSDGERIQICDNSSSDNSNCMANYLGVSVAEGEWFKLRIAFYPGEGTEQTVRAKVYFNDKLISISDNYYDYYGKKFIGAGKPNTEATVTRIQFLSGVESELLLDNVHGFFTKDVYKAEELHEDHSGPYSVNVDKLAEKAPVYGFEELSPGQNYPEIFTVTQGEGSVETVAFGEGKALSLSGGSKVNIPVSRTASFTNVAIISSDVFISEEAEGTVGYFDLSQHGMTDLSIIKFTLNVATAGGEKVVNVVESEKGTVISGFNIPVGKTVNLKIEYYYRDNVVLFYLDGELIGMSPEIANDSKRLVVNDLAISGSYGMTVDNISIEHGNKDYSTTMTPKYDSVTHGFDSGLGEITVTGNGVSVKKDGANSLLEIAPAGSTTVTVPVNSRDDVMNVSIIEFDIKFINKLKVGKHILSAVDGDGNKIYSVAVSQNGGKAYIYENTALGTHENPIAEFDAAKGAKISIEIYELQKLYKVFVDGEFSMSSSLAYSADNASLTPAAFKIESTIQAAGIRLDNIVFDRQRKAFIKDTVSNKEDDASEITFGYSGGDNYPSAIEATINSAAPLPTVTEFLRDGKVDKVLRYDTRPGGGDEVKVTPTQQVSGAVSYVFEAEIMFEEGSYAPFQIYVCDAGGNSMITIYYLLVSGDTIYMYTRNTEHKDSERVEIGKLGEWIDLRLEYYFVNGAPVIQAYVSDSLVLESGAEYPRSNMSRVGSVKFYGLSSGNGTMYIDNVSLKGSTKSYSSAE